jgi:UDP-3-O-[3-hydroxymyristoyl] glucosamine N-acyltransferase
LVAGVRALRINGAAINGAVQHAASKVFSLFIAGGFHQWGRDSVARLPLRSNGEQWISVGSGVHFGAGCWLNAEPAGPATAPVMVIGDGCRFAGGCVISAVSQVSIGREVLVARNVYIADHDHAYADTSQAIMHQGIASVGHVTVGDGAWLGQNCVVTSGVHIGRGAVVAANSVVTKDVPDYSLAAGAPAKVIKSWAPSQAQLTVTDRQV